MRLYFCFVSLALIGLTGCTHPPSAVPVTTKQRLPVWTSNAAMSRQLAAPYKIGAYSIQPPLGYTLQQSQLKEKSGTGIICNWTGPIHPDGTKPVLKVMIVDDSGHLSSQLRTSVGVRMIMAGYGRNHTNMVRSSIENGILNGKPFSRAYWQGQGTLTKKEFHGSVYLSIAALR